LTKATRERPARPATNVAVTKGPREDEPRFFVMLGAPGAGKGTQADRLSKALGLPHVSSGDVFREALRTDSSLGRQVRQYMERGALVPDDVTLRVMAERLSRADMRRGAILDGFPRTRPQAEALDELLAASGSAVRGALYIEADREELIHRLAGRRVCTGPAQHVYHVKWNPPKVEGICDIDGSPLEQRPDDLPETIRARLDKQLPPMYEVVDHYAERGALCAVRGDRPIDEVTSDLLHAASVADKSR
jgi:adenylate kinase